MFRNIKDKGIGLAKQKQINPYEIKIALDGLAVVVNLKNPVAKLTIDQLAGNFTGAITNWKEVGGEDKKFLFSPAKLIPAPMFILKSMF